ncbi:GrpB family protein [Jeotgalibacillus proteolyticus]|uniref:GrpB family protein n=1 Tax=Jeotgalibacillus proteolyticus TaxID=2082395 RepID=A0A2S5GAD7_9BACL|nr:GrpB family protein [Jeotgalibacillus proteolyticus]PPA69885.1 GrpB family protein [Jeotgalibacillus proteolyticus]
MIGLKKGSVILASPAVEWKRSFHEEKELLQSVLGEEIIDIQHIGSTAIKGIKAKPIIDMMVGIENVETFKNWKIEPLQKEGYYHLGKVKLEGKEVLAKFSDLKTLTKTHIVHVVQYKGQWWQEHTFFRDYLNANRDRAKEYEALKERLAALYHNEDIEYTDQKKEFVDSILLKQP